MLQEHVDWTKKLGMYDIPQPMMHIYQVICINSYFGNFR